IRADPSASVHAVGLVDTGDKEDQPNARVLNKISETINQIVAATVGNEQCPTVIRNLHEPRPITLREQSRPSRLPVARTRNGEPAINARPTALTWSNRFLRTRSVGFAEPTRRSRSR